MHLPEGSKYAMVASSKEMNFVYSMKNTDLCDLKTLHEETAGLELAALVRWLLYDSMYSMQSQRGM